MIGSLLSVLQQRMVMETGVSDRLLARIISGTESTMEVATTRVPTFGTNMQDPLNGYRSFGDLPSVNVQLEVPSHSASGFDRELLAARGGDNPDTREFMATWGPYGVTLETHFILIFTPLSNSGSSLNPDIPAGYQSCYSSVEDQSIPSPFFTTPVSVAWLQGVADASNSVTRTNSPASGMGTDYRQLSNPGSVITQFSETTPSQNIIQFSETTPSQNITQFSETTPSQNTTEFIPGTPIETVCRHHGISNDILLSAKFLTNEKVLVKMVQNFKWMSHILRCIGLQEHNTSFVASRTVVFAGGLILSAGAVVKHFGWAVDSFKHKNVWYRWAEDAARSREWAGTPLSELHHSARPFTCILTLALLQLIKRTKIT
jgi:hypothetical protein